MPRRRHPLLLRSQQPGRHGVLSLPIKTAKWYSTAPWHNLLSCIAQVLFASTPAGIFILPRRICAPPAYPWVEHRRKKMKTSQKNKMLNRVATVIAFAAGILLLALQFSYANGTVAKAIGL